MAPFNQLNRSEGRKAMEKSLTAAARARRRFKAGRPAKIRNDVLTPLEAIHRQVTEFTKLQKLMHQECLDTGDVMCALVYCTPELAGFEDVGRYKWIPAAGASYGYFMAIEALAQNAAILFLGLLFYQHDRDAVGENRHVAWLLPFMGGPKAESMLIAAREHFRAGGHRTLDN